MFKIIRLITAVIFMFFMAAPSYAADASYAFSSKTGPSPANMISMDFQDANLKTVLKIFSQQAGLNFVANQNVQDRKITIYFENVRVEDALNHIMNANNLVYEQESGSNIFIVKESGKADIETITKIYELKYAQLSPPPTEKSNETTQAQEPEILTVMKGLISKNGSIVADKRSNSLIIRDVPSQFAIIEDVLARLDVRTAQVMIEAEIIETTTSVADKLGVNWSGTWATLTGPVLNSNWPVNGPLLDHSTDYIKTAGSMALSEMTATLSAILSNADTRILARPKVLTLNNETATIELTAETAVASVTTTAASEGTSTSTSGSAERITTGITLNVTPQINKDGYITMHIEPTVIVPVISRFFSGSGSDAKFVDPQTRSAKTTVMVRDGETVIIGGLISREDTYLFEKIPLLGNLPFFGAAFRYKTTDESDKELLIFITPHIIKEATYALKDISDREQEKPKAVREKEINKALDLIGG
ncbi:MAG: secretin N-terminal domain-containing protein [Candidatus Omnitrophota bacterium]